MISYENIKNAGKLTLAAGSLMALLVACDPKKQIKVDEITISECPVKVEVIKNIQKGDDYYTINIYDSSRSLRASIFTNYLGNSDIFIHSDSGVVTGANPRFDVK